MSTRDTVGTETPAASAIAAIVTLPLPDTTGMLLTAGPSRLELSEPGIGILPCPDRTRNAWSDWDRSHMRFASRNTDFPQWLARGHSAGKSDVEVRRARAA
ncbi:hypothetical protein Aph02nite_42500 [Actinoplanes philippinensis]|nr:hypothetical protein Aph02nite_42500 [Actinoplanes philippinensis]